MLRVDPGTTRFLPFALFADDAETIPLALAAPGIAITGSSWSDAPALVEMISLANGTGRLIINLPAGEPSRKRHWIDLRIHIADGQSFTQRVPVLVGWPE